MFIKKLSLKNWTNYSEQEFEFSDKLNVLYGGNGQGKTNAVEGVFYLSTGYSQRKASDKNLLSFGKENGFAQIVASTKFGDVSIRANLSAKEKRVLLLNGVEVKKNRRTYGQRKRCVFFSVIIKGC